MRKYQRYLVALEWQLNLIEQRVRSNQGWLSSYHLLLRHLDDITQQLLSQRNPLDIHQSLEFQLTQFQKFERS